MRKRGRTLKVLILKSLCVEKFKKLTRKLNEEVKQRLNKRCIVWMKGEEKICVEK